MASLHTYAYPGLGDWARENMHYSQAVRVENKIVCSGQGKFDSPWGLTLIMYLTPYPGGWDRSKVEIKNDLMEEVDQAFDNVDANLKHAGGKGWSQVYVVRTYATDIKAVHNRIVENYRKWMPDHQPAWTEIAVKELGLPEMHIEIEVEAYDPEGAAEARGETVSR
jgi:enamine deaminase RidA (YjgF/YER057c/UK114 family)